MTATLPQNWLKTAGLVGVIGACLWSVIALQQARMKDITEQLATRNYQQEVSAEKIRLDILKTLPAFGFENMMADWTLLNFIQYYGDSDARKATGYELSADYLDIIVKHDPRFSRAYLIISPASSINAGTPDRTIAAMNYGLTKLTPHDRDAYLIWLYKGIDELLFKGDIPTAKQSYSKASEWARIAGDNFIADSAASTVRFLESNPDSRRAQVGAWFMVWVNTEDKQTREIAKSNIEALGGKLIVYPDGRVLGVPPKED